jgi:hypothetical protein
MPKEAQRPPRKTTRIVEAQACRRALGTGKKAGWRSSNPRGKAMLVRCYWLLRALTVHTGAALALCIAMHTLLRTADDTSTPVLGLELLGLGCTAALAVAYGLFCLPGASPSVAVLMAREYTAECAAITWVLFCGLTVWALVYDPMALPLTLASALAAAAWWRMARHARHLLSDIVKTDFSAAADAS